MLIYANPGVNYITTPALAGLIAMSTGRTMDKKVAYIAEML